MNKSIFRHPVRIFVGLGFPAEIDGVESAHALLDDWAPSRRDAAHRIALEACRAALTGEVDAETARAIFVAFARRHDLLASEAITGTARRDFRQARTGGMPA